MEIKARIDQLLQAFMKIPTHTNTPMEKQAEPFFRQWFDEVKAKYMNEKCDNIYFDCYDILGDALDRRIPWLLVRGDGPETAVLIHHSDTADVLDFGEFEPWAYESEILLKKLREAAEEGNLDLGASAAEDLCSDNWIFGRGGCDMKAGAAIEMALMEVYASWSKEGRLKGNLLLLSLPDEENLSLGMRSAPALMEMLKQRFGLQMKLMINTEPHDREDQACGTLYGGSVGKLMPVVYVKGVAAHVGQIYQGLNPILLLAEIVRASEQNPSFLEVRSKTGDSEVLTPPVWLCCKDRKHHYDVSLPVAASGYLSVLSLEKTPQQILEELMALSRKAFSDVLLQMANSREVYTQLSGKRVPDPGFEVEVLSFSEVLARAVARGGDVFKEAFEQEQNRVGVDMPEATVRLIELALSHAGFTTPVVVWALSPPYYPAVSSLDYGSKDDIASFLNWVEGIKAEAENVFGETYSLREHFFGICDLSYALCDFDEGEIQTIEENMPLWGNAYRIPFDQIRRLSMPVINIGPWGKDFHKLTERVLKQDVYERTPHLIARAVQLVLNQEDSAI